MATKTISVNPDFFSMSKKSKKSKRKTQKNNIKKNINMLQKNVLKQKMINKIKDYRKKKRVKKELDTDTKGIDSSFKTDYNNAVDFMEEIIKKKKTRKHKKHKRHEENKEQLVAHIIPVDVNTSKHGNNLLSNSISPDPPYGILKNGKKMLYSKYKQTKESPVLAFKDDSTFGTEQNITNTVNNFQKNIPSRQEKLENLKSKFLKNNILKHNKKEKFKIKSKKTKKIFELGKNKKTSKVGILIKNKRTRRLVDKDIRHLNKKKMRDIKRYLVEHSLIKVGSSAPNKILRDMYINCYSSGNITNSGGENAEDILMHNWSNNN